ncbi:hypothetical protein [Tissierella sp.]|uniref:hypothetical protein n=1 Tax=Tissierella sp. TaxID=41274 RepID=UPI0028AC4F2E|nr:hypothetical protein [Tissierella sp.]
MKRKYVVLLLLIALIPIISDAQNVFSYSILEESEPNNSLNSVSFSYPNSLSAGTYYIKIKRYSGYSESQYRVSFDVR